MKQHNDHDRIAIIGAGHVGSTAAYALMLRALVREIVLIDNDAALARLTANAGEDRKPGLCRK